MISTGSGNNFPTYSQTLHSHRDGRGLSFHSNRESRSDVSALDQPQSSRLSEDDFGFLLNERGVVLPSFAGPSPFPGAPAMTSGGSVPPPDAFAFYLPFHCFHPTWWGVYVVFEGAYELARLLNLFSNRRLSAPDAFATARLFLYGHEVFHHIVESFATRLEVTHRQSLYRHSFQEVFDSVFGTDQCVEEALATAHGYLKVKKFGFRHPNRPAVKAIALEALTEYIKSCPPGYRRATDFFRKAPFQRGRSQFAEQNHQCAFPSVPVKSPELWVAFPHAFSGISRVTSRSTI